jgi:hypothetical protein
VQLVAFDWYLARLSVLDGHVSAPMKLATCFYVLHTYMRGAKSISLRGKAVMYTLPVDDDCQE